MTHEQFFAELERFRVRWESEARADQTNDKARWIYQGVRLTVNFVGSLLLKVEP